MRNRIYQALIALLLVAGIGGLAWGTVSTYQYKDNTNSAFNIQLFQCIAGPIYCTSMVVQDSTGVEKFTSGNPGIVSDTALLTAVSGPPTLGSTSGGKTLVSLAGLTNTAVVIKNTPGQLYWLQCINPNSSVAYVQLFNVAAASVTVGTSASTPVGIAANSTGGLSMGDLVGGQFATAISAAATITATGGTAPVTALDCSVGYN
jgi:hypothetical protein